MNKKMNEETKELTAKFSTMSIKSVREFSRALNVYNFIVNVCGILCIMAAFHSSFAFSVISVIAMTILAYIGIAINCGQKLVRNYLKDKPDE